MNSVYTLTLSPSLDCSTSTDKIYPEGKLRCSQAIYQPGGGGVNVARAIYRMGEAQWPSILREDRPVHT